MKKVYKQISLALVLVSIVSVLAVSPLSAIAVSTGSTSMEEESYTVSAHNQHQMNISVRSRINISSNTDSSITGHLKSVSTLEDKEFALDVDEAPGDLTINMTCTEEEAELGLTKGNRVTARNRHRFTYREQFVVNISCNCTENLQTRLRIKATEQNREGTWAYFNESNGEWESVETQVEDGYLVADTDHFSTWTVLVPESQATIDLLMVAGIVVGVIAVIGLVGAVGYVYKKK